MMISIRSARSVGKLLSTLAVLLILGSFASAVRADTVGSWNGNTRDGVTMVPAVASALSWTCGLPCWPGQTPPFNLVLKLKPLSAFLATDYVWAAIGNTAPSWHPFSQLTVLTPTSTPAPAPTSAPSSVTPAAMVGSWDGNAQHGIAMVPIGASVVSWTCGLPCWPGQTPPFNLVLKLKPLSAFAPGDAVWAAIGNTAATWHWFAELASLMPSSATSSTAADTVSISGSPAAITTVGTPYSFAPTANDSLGKALSFSVANAPAWASFNSVTGQLQGTPSAGDVGTYTNIRISASDGAASAALAVFSIAVTQVANGSVTLSWLPPTQNSDGTPITNLAGYRIYYGTGPTALSHSVQLTNPGLTTYLLDNLSAGTYYFALTAYNSSGLESSLSGTTSKGVL